MKVSSCIAQYPVLCTVQGALHYIPWQTNTYLVDVTRHLYECNSELRSMLSRAVSNVFTPRAYCARLRGGFWPKLIETVKV